MGVPHVRPGDRFADCFGVPRVSALPWWTSSPPIRWVRTEQHRINPCFPCYSGLCEFGRTVDSFCFAYAVIRPLYTKYLSRRAWLGHFIGSFSNSTTPLMKPIRVVCGTRTSQQDFASKTALGRSLVIHQEANPVDVLLFAENGQGLSTIYNLAIEHAREKPAILVFVHDDVHLCDFHWGERISEAVQTFNVVGVAGNTRRVPQQPGWAFVDDRFTWDQKQYLSGIVGHGKNFPCHLSNFGPTPQACKLLDGLLLAADSERLIESGVRFDEQFKFHFYDLDFCRQAELANLTMGTWPLSVVHESGGAFNTPAWCEALGQYRSKYAN